MRNAYISFVVISVSFISIYSMSIGNIQMQTNYATSNTPRVYAIDNNTKSSMPEQNSTVSLSLPSLKNAINSEQLKDFSSSIPSTNTTIHSQYLTISKTNMRTTSDFLSTKSITGTIINNSTQSVDNIQVYAALFDPNNNLVDVASGIVDSAILNPQGDSSFTIDFYEDSNIKVVKYMLFVVGTPTSE